jgi:hypothetical protein
MDYTGLKETEIKFIQQLFAYIPAQNYTEIHFKVLKMIWRGTCSSAAI